MRYSRHITILVLAMLLSAGGMVNADIPRGDLRVVISEFRSEQGTINLGLYDSREGYLSRGSIPPFRKAKIPVEGEAVEHVFRDVPFGEYTIKYFQDENRNGKVDFNFLRIPMEPYGFSNNARALGLPPYERAKFELNTERMTVELRML